LKNYSLTRKQWRVYITKNITQNRVKVVYKGALRFKCLCSKRKGEEKTNKIDKIFANLIKEKVKEKME
jgi:hypothetical protein